MSKVIRDCIGFALVCSVIALENMRYFLNQSVAKLKPIVTSSLMFFHAWRHLLVFTLSSDWLLGISPFVLIGCCDYFDFMTESTLITMANKNKGKHHKEPVRTQSKYNM